MAEHSTAGVGTNSVDILGSSPGNREQIVLKTRNVENLLKMSWFL
jgi:hypothetical protein